MNGWGWVAIAAGAVAVLAGGFAVLWLGCCILAGRTDQRKPPARQETSPPAAPGTRTPRIHPRLGPHVLTVRYYAGGSVIWDNRGHKVAEFSQQLPSDEEFDDWLRSLTQ